MRVMFALKTKAMKRIAAATDRVGGETFPSFMRDSMKQWEREGLITIDQHGTRAVITDKGRALAKKVMQP